MSIQDKNACAARRASRREERLPRQLLSGRQTRLSLRLPRRDVR
nr:MAG TPA: hypothetical protein [Caudoviricetes sp.]